MPFQILKVELDDTGHVTAQRPTQPLFELEDDAYALAEFDASRLGEDYGYDSKRGCWWSTGSSGRRTEFVVKELHGAA